MVELVGRRLETAGSFTYTGTASATDVSPVRPGPWLTVNTTIEGRVDLSTRRLHLVLDLTGLGGPVAVAPPGAAPSEGQALPDA